jgi:hypothetical protein
MWFISFDIQEEKKKKKKKKRKKKKKKENWKWTTPAYALIAAACGFPTSQNAWRSHSRTKMWC